MLKPAAAVIFLLPLYLIVLIFGIKKMFSLSKHIFVFAFYFYIIAVIAVTFFPFPIQPSYIKDMQESNYLRNNFIPFKSILEMMRHDNIQIILRQILGNIILFVPFGFFVPLIFKRLSHFTSIVIAGFLSSISIELLQFIFSSILGYTYKITDVDDIILNTIGTVVGFIVLRLFFVLIGNRQIIESQET